MTKVTVDYKDLSPEARLRVAATQGFIITDFGKFTLYGATAPERMAEAKFINRWAGELFQMGSEVMFNMNEDFFKGRLCKAGHVNGNGVFNVGPAFGAGKSR